MPGLRWESSITSTTKNTPCRVRRQGVSRIQEDLVVNRLFSPFSLPGSHTGKRQPEQPPNKNAGRFWDCPVGWRWLHHGCRQNVNVPRRGESAIPVSRVAGPTTVRILGLDEELRVVFPPVPGIAWIEGHGTAGSIGRGIMQIRDLRRVSQANRGLESLIGGPHAIGVAEIAVPGATGTVLPIGVDPIQGRLQIRIRGRIAVVRHHRSAGHLSSCDWNVPH